MVYVDTLYVVYVPACTDYLMLSSLPVFFFCSWEAYQGHRKSSRWVSCKTSLLIINHPFTAFCKKIEVITSPANLFSQINEHSWVTYRKLRKYMPYYRSVPLIRPPILYTTSNLKWGEGLYSNMQLVSSISPPPQKFTRALHTLPKFMFT